MSFIVDNIAIVWIIVGVMFLFLEASGASGVGFLFAGLATLSVGGLVSFSLIDNYDYTNQFVFCFLLVVVWVAILWYPLRKFKSLGSSDKPYQNITGSIATLVTDSIANSQDAKIKWSGTLMNAKAKISTQGRILGKGEKVVIESISGNIATIIPEDEFNKNIDDNKF